MKFLSVIKKNIKQINKQPIKLQLIIYAVFATVLIVVISVPIMIITAVSDNDSVAPGNILSGGEIAYKGNTLYAVNPEDSKIYRIKGDSKSAISDITHCKNLVINKNYIYFIGGMEFGKSGIYKTHLKNFETTLIYNGNTAMFDIYDDILYFISSPTDGEKMSVMKLDGSRRRELSKLTVTCFYVCDDMIFYSDKQQQLYSNDLDGKSETLLKDIITNEFFAENKKLYFISGSSLFRCNFSGEKKKELFSGDIRHFNIQNKRIYFSCDNGILTDKAKTIYSGEADDVYIHKKQVITIAGNEIIKTNINTQKTEKISFV